MYLSIFVSIPLYISSFSVYIIHLYLIFILYLCLSISSSFYLSHLFYLLLYLSIYLFFYLFISCTQHSPTPHNPSNNHSLTLQHRRQVSRGVPDPHLP